MAGRSHRASIANETIDILSRGTYRGPDGDEISIESSLRAAVDGTVVYLPEDGDELLARRQASADDLPASEGTKYSVLNTTTLAAAQRLLLDHPAERVACLNFASAKNPGGGFLNGAQAQEECLARASGLYACIRGAATYYESNRNCGTALYTDHVIYSPNVPVFRGDDDRLLAAPYLTSIITAPAVNAGAVMKNEPQRSSQIEPVMRRRIEKVLAVAAEQKQTALVLGAWGCGVFRISRTTSLRGFHEALTVHNLFQDAFNGSYFAVLDGTDNGRFINPFAEQFSKA